MRRDAAAGLSWAGLGWSEPSERAWAELGWAGQGRAYLTPRQLALLGKAVQHVPFPRLTLRPAAAEHLLLHAPAERRLLASDML